MLDLKTMNSALEQLEAERGISKEKIIEVIKDALAAAYKKDYGKRGQIIRAEFDPASGKAEFYQVKLVVDESMVRTPEEHEMEDELKETGTTQDEQKRNKDLEEDPAGEEEEKKPRFNPEYHILLEDAQKIKKGAKLGEEIIFPLETKDDYGRIAAQTAKQVIMQRIREAERISVTEEYEKRKGEIVSGTVQRIERGNVYLDLGRITGVMPYDEQIPGERFRIGERMQAYLFAVEETPRDISLRLSRTHPKFLEKLFEREVPEIASGSVEIKATTREPGSRTKIAVVTHDEHIDPVGSCVGQRGVRVATVMSEAGGEKIDIIEWSDDHQKFIERALSPAHIEKVTINEQGRYATIEVSPDQYSLAIGKGGQNARLAAKLTGWKIDIRESTGRHELSSDGEMINEKEADKESNEKPKDTGRKDK